MKFAVFCLLCVVLSLATKFSSAQWNSRNKNYRLGRNTNIGKNGLNHRSNNGRHNTNLNYRQFRYNYAGNQWNTNVNHNFRSRQTNLNANYRRNHNFRVGHNWQNRQTNLGYTWNFGKRRRSTDIQDEVLEFLKIESEPRVFLKKFQLAVDMFIKRYQDTVPELKILSVSVPKSQITNATVVQEMLCVIKKLQKLLPNNMGNFIVKMIKYHGRSFGVENLRNFFGVDPEEMENNACEIPDVPARNELVDRVTLLEAKKFIATLITVTLEYQQMLKN